MPSTKTRLIGSGYTGIFFGGTGSGTNNIPIAFTQMLNETTPELVGEKAKDIHPMDHSRPAEIMVSQAMTGGEIEVGLFETWSENAWNRLGRAVPGLRGAARGGNYNDTILDIVRAITNARGEIFLTKMIYTPGTSGEVQVQTPKRRSILYMGAKITAVTDGDQNADIETMEQVKNITFRYTHRLYRYHNNNRNTFGSFSVRGGQFAPNDSAGPQLNRNI